MNRDVPVTVRVSQDLKERVDALALEVGISSSAVWKILLHRSVGPLMDGRPFDAIDLFKDDALTRRVPVQDARPPPGRAPARERGFHDAYDSRPGLR